MNNFINHIIARHITPDNNVKPRIRSRFESTNNIFGHSAFEQEVSTGNEQSSALQQTTLFIHKDIQSGIFPSESNRLNTSTQNGKEDMTWRDKTSNSSATPSPLNIKNTTEQHLQENKSNIAPSTSYNETYPDTIAAINREANTNRQEEKILNAGVLKDINSNNINNYFPQQTNVFDTPFRKPFTESKELVKPISAQPQPLASALQNEKNNAMKMVVDPSRLQHFNQLPDTSVQPVIKVTIGRIDVRAVVPPTPAPAKSKTEAKPKLTLEDYLNRRNHTS